MAAGTAAIILGLGLLALPLVEQAAGQWDQFELATSRDAEVARYRNGLGAAYDAVVSDFESPLVAFEIGALPTTVTGTVIDPAAPSPRRRAAADPNGVYEPPATASVGLADLDGVTIRIPAIGLDQAVVEGVSRDDLQKGPGHFPGTAMPGSVGNSVISGHRTTYTKPFHDLDQLEPGDLILIESPTRSVRYIVSQSFVVEPTDVAPLAGTATPTLTLTTCHPLGSADQRLIVVAQLDEPVP